jgi:NTP pyrophosphatase (non-canonical NTP hydrolase)
MKNYIELAHSTSAPVGPCRERLKGPLLALLFHKLLELDNLANDLDKLKRAIFYGAASTDGSMILSADADECAQHALREDATIELLHAGLGLATEAGEFLSPIFDLIFQGLELDAVNVGEEIGDSLWYLAKACKFTGTTLELEQVRNIAKLAKRFPQKFTDADALQRDLDAERKTLEAPIKKEDEGKLSEQRYAELLNENYLRD